MPGRAEDLMRAREYAGLEVDGSMPRAAPKQGAETPALELRAALARRFDVAGPAGLQRVQRAVGNAGAAALLAADRTAGEESIEPSDSPVRPVLDGAGLPLGPTTRADMESRFGQDFGDVRVHTDEAAHRSARAMNAVAYTVGTHIAFQRAAFDPESTGGRTLLAHELAHVVQQRYGAVAGSPGPGGVLVSDPSDRFEREAATTAEQIVGGVPQSCGEGDCDSGAGADGSVQRQAEEEEEEVEEPTG